MNGDVLIREASPEELPNWDKLVTRFDNYRIFHKQSWMRSVEAFSGAKPLYLIFEKNGEIVACLPGFFLKVAFLRVFASPREGWQAESMGPVFDQSQISTREMFTVLIPFLEKQYGVHHIELACAQLDHEVMNEMGFQGKSLFTQRVNLFPGDTERTFKNMKYEARRNVRKATKLGLLVRIKSEERFVDEFYNQAKEVFARNGYALPFSRSRVLQFFRYMKESGNLLAISVVMPDDSTCIATGMFTIEGQELILWGWAHRYGYRRHYPTELMTWTAIEKAVEAGCTTFDMTGRGRFKEKFGTFPDESNYRWIRSRYKWLALLRDGAKEAYRWQQSLRGRISQRRLLGVLEQAGLTSAKPNKGDDN